MLARSGRFADKRRYVDFSRSFRCGAVLDGELVAFDEDGKPDFPLICECLVQRHYSIPLTYMIFDVLSYVPGERAWVKTKNRDYWRWELEREGALKIRRERQFV
jgi:ATP-dependent DNA ligase